jgi:hypothetical protein
VESDVLSGVVRRFGIGVGSGGRFPGLVGLVVGRLLVGFDLFGLGDVAEVDVVVDLAVRVVDVQFHAVVVDVKSEVDVLVERVTPGVGLVRRRLGFVFDVDVAEEVLRLVVVEFDVGQFVVRSVGRE